MKSNLQHKLTFFPQGRTIEVIDGALLLEALRDNGVFIPAQCGGNAACRKCKVKIISGKTDGSAPDTNGYVLSCEAKICEDLVIEIPPETYRTRKEVKADIPADEQLSGAVDIGTTVICAKITSMSGENVYSSISCMNPQCVFGADVLNRISACHNGKLFELQRLLNEKLRDMILEMSGKRRLKRLYVAANTTMLHILMGVDPTPIGAYPFTPIFTDTKHIKGDELGLPVDDIYLFASAGAYIGADITCGAFYLGMHNEKDTVLLVDIGTNGEILLAHEGQLYAASSAAGPALEGASIKCGVGGVDGAIDSLTYEDGELSITTVNGAHPIGICGSGLIDLVAILLEEGIIDETGAFDYDSKSKLMERMVQDNFYITDSLYLSAADIRQLQVAKAAISAAIEAVLTVPGITSFDVSRLYICGGLGKYMNIKNAIRIGIIPKAFENKSIAVGNTALNGALLACKQHGVIHEVEELAKRINIVELSFSDVFRNRYVENMFF